MIVGAGVVIPVALLALVALLAGRWLLPAVRRRTSHVIERPLPIDGGEGRAECPALAASRTSSMTSLDPTQPVLVALDVSLPDLVAFELERHLAERRELGRLRDACPGIVTFTPFTLCP